MSVCVSVCVCACVCVRGCVCGCTWIKKVQVGHGFILFTTTSRLSPAELLMLCTDRQLSGKKTSGVDLCFADFPLKLTGAPTFAGPCVDQRQGGLCVQHF